jgi:hypothetical protein
LLVADLQVLSQLSFPSRTHRDPDCATGAAHHCVTPVNNRVTQSIIGGMYSAIPDVYGQLHLIPNTQNISLKSWWVGKNHRAWFEKNDYHKIKIICINKTIYKFFHIN